jgi:hypothetical protein
MVAVSPRGSPNRPSTHASPILQRKDGTAPISKAPHEDMVLYSTADVESYRGRAGSSLRVGRGRAADQNPSGSGTYDALEA